MGGAVATRSAIIILLLSFLATACSQLAPVNALTPPKGYTRTKAIRYADTPHEYQKLDVFVPKKPLAEPAPVVVFFHGGTWQHGSRPEYRFAGQALASRGFVTVVAGYRLYPEVKFPTFLEDASRAVMWTHENIADYGGDPDQLFVMGHSAGGHISVMLTVDEQWGVNDLIKAAASLSGAMDFRPITDPTKLKIFGATEAEWALSQPVEFVADGTHAPIFLLHGEKDTTVSVKQARKMAAAIEAAGGSVQTKYYKRWGHVRILLALAAPLRWLGPTLDDVAAFFKDQSTATSARR